MTARPYPRAVTGPRPPERELVPVLIVEEDPLLGEMLEAALRLHRPELVTAVATSLGEALELAGQREFRLVVSDLGRPAPLAAPDFVARLHRLLPATPVLVLTGGSKEALAALLELDVAVITKPLDMDHLLRRVDQLLERRGGSLVQGVSLESLLQLLEAEFKTCRVGVSAKAGEGWLWLIEGRLVHAEAASRRGVDALFAVLGWREPVLRIVNEVSPARSIDRDLRSLLLDYCVDLDHRTRDVQLG